MSKASLSRPHFHFTDEKNGKLSDSNTCCGLKLFLLDKREKVLKRFNFFSVFLCKIAKVEKSVWKIQEWIFKKIKAQAHGSEKKLRIYREIVVCGFI